MKELWNLENDVAEYGQNMYNALQPQFEGIDKIRGKNQLKVIKSLQKHNLSEQHFSGTTGYGYGDLGRELLNKVMADIMGAEDSLVSVYWVSGTHAISDALKALLEHGDALLSVTGTPYDTLNKVIKNFKDINYREVSVVLTQGIDFYMSRGLPSGLSDEEFNALYLEEMKVELVRFNPKVVFIQKSKGYAWRKTLTNSDIEVIIKAIKEISPKSIVVVDNCYGEFVEENEPCEVGADLVVGSLIKNPGGGLAPTGGYVAGKEDLVEKVAEELTAPGLDRDMGATLNTNRSVIQGLYIAPHTVGEALKGAVFNAIIYKRLHYNVLPQPEDKRGDIIQATDLGSRKRLINYVKGVQQAGAVDSNVKPVPEEMPGYECKIIMAAGAFIQGSSLEVSADAPIRQPYIVYFQGGLSLTHSILGTMLSFQMIRKQ